MSEKPQLPEITAFGVRRVAKESEVGRQRLTDIPAHQGAGGLGKFYNLEGDWLMGNSAG